MATDLERLVVQLSADVKGYERALARANGITGRQFTAIERRGRQMQQRLNGIFAGVGRQFVGIFAAGASVRGAQQLIDTSTRITNSLKVAGLEGEALSSVYDQLFASAQRNSAPIEALVTLYGRAALVQNELGVSSQQLISFTDNISLALRVAGVDAQTASGALLQLSQALGSGVVRAEEFNSILEGAPTILQAAAAGIQQAEGSVAKLRTIMLDGGLSSRALFDGIAAGSELMEQKVSGAESTITQRLTRLNNVLIDAAKEFNDASSASEGFGGVIDGVADSIAALDFQNIITQVDRVIAAMNTGIAAVQNFGFELGRLSGLENIGSLIYTSRPNFLGSYSTKDVQDRVAAAFEGSAQNNGGLTPEAIQRAASGALPKGGRLPASGVVNPIDLEDPLYTPPALGGGGGGGGGRRGGGGGGGAKERADEYERLVQKITEARAATLAESEALAGINPLVEDFGFALEQARAKQDLLTAAQQAGKTVTPELAAEIDALATSYAQATADAARLADSQDEIRQKAEEMREFQKDLTRGIVDGFREGKDAADIFADALNKIADRLLDIAFDAAFSAPKGGGGGGGLFGAIRSLLPFDKGGYTGDGDKYEPAGVVHRGEYVFDKDAVRAAGGPRALDAARRRLKGYANGGAVGAPSMPRLGGMSAPAAAGSDYINVSGSFAVENGNLVPLITGISGQVAGKQVKQVNRGLPGRIQSIQARGK